MSRRSIYSADYLTQPLEIEQESLPQMNKVKTPGTQKGSIYGALYGVGSELTNNSQANPDFASQSPSLQKAQRTEQTFNTAKSAVAAVPVIGTAIAGFASVGQAVGKTTTDQYGKYKSKGAEILDNNVNPLTGVKNVLSITGDIGNGGKFDWENVANFATSGLIGKTTAQKALEKEKSFFDMKKIVDKSMKNQQQGALNATANFKALPYGRNGMKIRTKLSSYK